MQPDDVASICTTKPGPRPGTVYQSRPGPVLGRMRNRNVDPRSLSPAIKAMEEYLEWLLVTAHSPCTVRSRRVIIRRFCFWAYERHLVAPDDFASNVFESYQRSLFEHRKKDGMPLSIGTQHQCLVALKGFFGWLAAEGRLPCDPTSKLTLPKLPKHLPRSLLSVPDVRTILSRTDPTTACGLRDRALLELLYSTGLRRSEIAALKCFDVDLTGFRVFVREGKGRKDRVLPMGRRAGFWVGKYFVDSRPELLVGEHDFLFVSNYGDPITPDWLSSRVRRCLVASGIGKPGCCHLFRHACATHMLDNGADIRFIQEMLGHASLSTTERYTHVALSKLEQVHAATHPGAKLET